VTATDRPTVSLEELLSGVTERRPLVMADSKSGVLLERVRIGGEPFVVKHLHADDDWIQRVTGDLTCRPAVLWQAGVSAQLPDCIDDAVVGVATGLGRGGWGAALLMRDVGPLLVPEGDDPVPVDQALRFVDHMAALHAAFWGWTSPYDLLPAAHRYLFLHPVNIATEMTRADASPIPAIAVDGWDRFAGTSPLADDVLALRSAPWPLVEALAATPQTLLHGDWKMGNLGSHPDGRTVLIDWAMSGIGSPASDLAWYLALNAARLPHRKEAAIDAYAAALEDHGVSKTGWWDTALDLALLGGLVQLGWEKALGDRAELAWWEERARAGLARL
jgi:hypothetical protein